MEAQDIISSGLLELYVMGIASLEEIREVELSVASNPEVAAELEAISAALENYAQAHAITPASSVKDKLLGALQVTAASASPVPVQVPAKLRSISPYNKFAAAAGIVLLLGSLALNYTFYNRYKSASSDLVAAKTELQQQKELAAAMHEDMGVMADKNAMPVSLKAMPDVPDAAARIYWMQNTHEVYIDPSNLPKAPQGMQYQFWAIVDGKPVNGGIIKTLEDGRIVHVQKMTSFGRAEAFAVSLEPAGPEKPVPTHVYVMGKM